jgi:hypothetical protein
MVARKLSRHGDGPVKVPSLISLLALLFLGLLPASAQQPGKVDFPATVIPRIPTSLPTLRMNVQAPPEVFLTDVLTRMGIQKPTIQQLVRTPSVAARGVSPQMKGVVQQDRVLAYWHLQTGEAEILPQLEQLRTERYVPGSNPHAANALSTARAIFARPDVLPKDVTQVELTPVKPLVGVTIQRGSGNTAPAAALYLSYVAAHRTVQGIPVQGPGSRALVAVDNAGTVQAFSLHWRTASNGEQAQETRNVNQIHAALQAAVQPLARNGDVQVLNVGVVYYDDNQSPQMAPAYRILARVHDSHPLARGQTALDDSLVILYAPYGNAPLPPGLTEGGPEPRFAIPNTRGSLQQDTPMAPGDPTVGVYVIRNAESAWLSDAQGFIGNLGASPGSSQFNLTQYYWSTPNMYYPNASSFIDAVQIGEVEGHGNWWEFATYDKDPSFNTDNNSAVYFDAFPNGSGYGLANHGQLNYWILHGCEEIPSPEDAPCPSGAPTQDSRTWTDPWWRIFQGLHVVVGYRTIMLIADDVGATFASSARNGTPVVSAWISAAESASAYHPDGTYGNHCGLNLPEGRPAAVAVCGHGNDTLFDQQSIGAASCLTIYWQPN